MEKLPQVRNRARQVTPTSSFVAQGNRAPESSPTSTNSGRQNASRPATTSTTQSPAISTRLQPLSISSSDKSKLLQQHKCHYALPRSRPLQRQWSKFHQLHQLHTYLMAKPRQGAALENWLQAATQKRVSSCPLTQFMIFLCPCVIDVPSKNPLGSAVFSPTWFLPYSFGTVFLFQDSFEPVFLCESLPLPSIEYQH